MTIDIRDVNDLGPLRFRTQTDNNQEQIFYYNQNKRDKTFNCFLALRTQTSATDKIIFSIEHLIDKTNRKEDIYFEINDELSDFINDLNQFGPRVHALVKATLAEKQLISKYNNNSNNTNNKENVEPEMADKSAKSRHSFQSNKPSNKRTDRKYTTTLIKSRNFLSNISYAGINKEDF